MNNVPQSKKNSLIYKITQLHRKAVSWSRIYTDEEAIIDLMIEYGVKSDMEAAEIIGDVLDELEYFDGDKLERIPRMLMEVLSREQKTNM